MKNKTVKLIIRIILIALGIVCIAVFIGPAPWLIFNLGSIAGIIIGAIITAVGVFLNRILEWCKKESKKKSGRVILSVIGAVIICGVTVFSVTLASIIRASDNKAENCTSVIVLGCAVEGDNPSIMLRDRINAAYEYLSAHPQAKAVLSGGQGANENLSEAQCMYNKLTERGIDSSRLYMEDQSTNTAENIKNSAEIIKKNNMSTTVAVATSDFHEKRASMVCEMNGLKAKAISVETRGFLIPIFFMREVLGVIKEVVL